MAQQPQPPNQGRRKLLKAGLLVATHSLVYSLGWLTGIYNSPKTGNVIEKERVEVREREILQPTTITITQPGETKTLERTVTKYSTTETITNFQTKTLTQTVTQFSTQTLRESRTSGNFNEIAGRLGDGRIDNLKLYLFCHQPILGYNYFRDNSTAILTREQLKRYIQRRGIREEFDYVEAYIKIRREDRYNPNFDNLRVELEFYSRQDSPQYLGITREEPIGLLFGDVLDINEKLEVNYSIDGINYKMLGEIKGE